jgi:hypothetical protein
MLHFDARPLARGCTATTIAALAALAALAACAAPPAEGRADSAAGEVTVAAKAPLLTADVAGRWRFKAMSYRGDSLTSYELTATADTTGWSITFPNRPALPLQVVAVRGDSIVTETGPYPSVLRQTVGVRSLRTIHRLEGNEIVGSFTARYETTAPDSVLHGTIVGRRAR